MAAGQDVGSCSLQAFRQDEGKANSKAHHRVTLAIYLAGSTTVGKGKTNVVDSAFNAAAGAE